VLAGRALSAADSERLRRALRNAEALSGFPFSLYLGEADADTRAYAVRVHAGLDDPARAVLVLCDPEARALEIVVGSEASRRLDRRSCNLAAASMQTSFVGGDLIGGLVAGIQQLGEAARAPRTLHSSH